jgi:hypothetical protein
VKILLSPLTETKSPYSKNPKFGENQFMKYSWILFAIIALVMTACGPAPEPTMSPEEVQSTAMAAAMTMVAETQAAIPTATPIPPTETPSPTPPPTNTVPRSDQPDAWHAGRRGWGAANTADTGGWFHTNEHCSPISRVENDPCLQYKSSWAGETAKLSLVNNTKPKGNIVFSIGFTSTQMGECGIAWGGTLSGNTTIQVPLGSFWASAFVDGKNDFKVFGGDVIAQPGSYSLWIENERSSLKLVALRIAKSQPGEFY